MRTVVLFGWIALGCGPAVSDDAASSSGGQTSSSSSSDSGAEVSTGAMTTSSGSASSSGDATTSGDATGSSSSGTADVIYRAVALPTGVPRILIAKQNATASTCTWIIISSGTSDILDIATPRGWMVEMAGVNDEPASCDEQFPAMFGAVLASTGTGTIDFDTSMTPIPETIDVDVALTFEEGLGGTPLADELVAQGLVVEFE
jgi:hypothetical protein